MEAFSRNEMSNRFCWSWCASDHDFSEVDNVFITRDDLVSIDDELGTVLDAFGRLHALGVTEENYDSLFASDTPSFELNLPRTVAMSAAGRPIDLLNISEFTDHKRESSKVKRRLPGEPVHHSNAKLYAAVLERTRAVEGRELLRAIRDGMEVIVPPAALELLSWEDLRIRLALSPPATQALLEGWAWDDAWRKSHLNSNA